MHHRCRLTSDLKSSFPSQVKQTKLRWRIKPNVWEVIQLASLLFAATCLMGTIGIIMRAPSLYDPRIPIDAKLSEIPTFWRARKWKYCRRSFIFARDMYNYHKSAMLHLYEIQKNCMESIWFTAPVDNIRHRGEDETPIKLAGMVPSFRGLQTVFLRGLLIDET